MMKRKRCSKCGEKKQLKDFSQNQSWCKTCAAEYQANNRGKLRQSEAKYRANNREKLRQRSAEYQANNHKKVLRRYAEYRTNNHEKVRKYQVEYRANNREKVRQRNVEYHVKAVDGYIKFQLRKKGIYHPSARLVELKRQGIIMGRNIKQLKEATNGSTNKECNRNQQSL